MPPAQLLELALCLEPLERVLPDRLEQAEARLAVGAVRLADEALVDERREALEHLAEVHLSPQTASATSSEQPPAKTPSRASSACSDGSSRL